jgi:hypothetical protein
MYKLRSYVFRKKTQGLTVKKLQRGREKLRIKVDLYNMRATFVTAETDIKF